MRIFLQLRIYIVILFLAAPSFSHARSPFTRDNCVSALRLLGVLKMPHPEDSIDEWAAEKLLDEHRLAENEIYILEMNPSHAIIYTQRYSYDLERRQVSGEFESQTATRVTRSSGKRQVPLKTVNSKDWTLTEITLSESDKRGLAQITIGSFDRSSSLWTNYFIDEFPPLLGFKPQRINRIHKIAAPKVVRQLNRLKRLTLTGVAALGLIYGSNRGMSYAGSQASKILTDRMQLIESGKSNWSSKEDLLRWIAIHGAEPIELTKVLRESESTMPHMEPIFRKLYTKDRSPFLRDESAIALLHDPRSTPAPFVWPFVPDFLQSPEELTQDIVGRMLFYNDWPQSFWDEVPRLLKSDKASTQRILLEALASKQEWPQAVWDEIPALLESDYTVIRWRAADAVDEQKTWPDSFWNSVPRLLQNSSEDKRYSALRALRQKQLTPLVWDAFIENVRANDFNIWSLYVLDEQKSWPESFWKFFPELINRANPSERIWLSDALLSQSAWPESFWKEMPKLFNNKSLFGANVKQAIIQRPDCPKWFLEEIDRREGEY